MIGPSMVRWPRGERLGIAVIAVMLPGLAYGASPSERSSCDFWVAPSPVGDDASPGTAANPWATMGHAAAAVPDQGCTVHFAPGVYSGRNSLKRRFAQPTTFAAAAPYGSVLEHSSTVLDIDGGRNIVIEGFEIRHDGPGTSGYVAIVDRRDETVWAEDITLRNNIIHDSFGDDLLKIHNGVRLATVEGNVFYNQGDREQHIDINSVTDVLVQDNILFNDFEGSNRENTRATKHFIVIKDSNESADGLEGSERITIRRNVMLNWQGGPETYLKVGNDGKAYHEAKNVLLANNLIIGNGTDLADAAFGVRGARDVRIVNNTVVGDLPAKRYAYHAHLKGDNPPNENIALVNNIWADPTGTMGEGWTGRGATLSRSSPHETLGLLHHGNLYWNAGAPIPRGKYINPMTDDTYRKVGDPQLFADHSDIRLPRWTGRAFASGNATVRQEFRRLVERYGSIPANSIAVDAGDPRLAMDHDILRRPRTVPDIGAYEAGSRLATDPPPSLASTLWIWALISGGVALAVLPLVAARRHRLRRRSSGSPRPALHLGGWWRP